MGVRFSRQLFLRVQQEPVTNATLAMLSQAISLLSFRSRAGQHSVTLASQLLALPPLLCRVATLASQWLYPVVNATNNYC